MNGDFHYLLAVLVGAPPVVIAFIFVREERSMMALGGALMTIVAPLTIYFQGVYWNPQRFVQLFVGIEDILLCFFLGSLVWACAIYFVRKRYYVNLDSKRLAFRLLLLTVVNGLPLYILWSFGMSPMIAIIAIQWIVVIELLFLKPRLWPLPILSVLIYTPIYFAWLWVARHVGVDFDAIWSGPTLWGPRIVGVPVDEIAFAISYAASYPLVLGYVADVRAKTEDLKPVYGSHSPIADGAKRRSP